MIGVRSGDGTERVDGGSRDLARRNDIGSSSSTYGSSTCSRFISGSIWGSSVGSICSSRNRSISCGMEQPGVVVVSRNGSRGGSSLAVEVMVKPKRHKRRILYFEGSLTMFFVVQSAVAICDPRECMCDSSTSYHMTGDATNVSIRMAPSEG